MENAVQIDVEPIVEIPFSFQFFHSCPLRTQSHMDDLSEQYHDDAPFILLAPNGDAIKLNDDICSSAFRYGNYFRRKSGILQASDKWDEF
jgi:hypothetical protein